MVVDYDARPGSFIPGRARRWGDVRIQLSAAPEISNGNFDVTPDGKRVLGHVATGNFDTQPAGKITVLLNFFGELRRRVP